MITIFCGEDSVAARTAFTDAVEKYRATHAEIIPVEPSFIMDIYKGIAENLLLFSSQKIFCTENLEKYSFKKSTKTKKDSVYEAIVALSLDKSVVLLDFEEGKQARQLKLKDHAKVYESKPGTNIFKLTEECFPGNKLNFVKSLRTVCESQDEMFVFIMLTRHLRQLVLAVNDIPSGKLPPWQKYKVLGQAKKWEKLALTHFYSGLIKIEISAKTSSNPYGVRKSLEILACHYL